MKKKLLITFILLLIASLSLLCSCSSSGKKEYIEGLEYQKISGKEEYEVVGIGDAKGEKIIIPPTYNDLPVTSIGDGAFSWCDSLTSVVIPDSVTSIGDSAFEDCSSLMSVDIPDSVISIGYMAFRNCDSLTSVEIGASVTSIGWAAFLECESLTSVVIPDSVTSIGYYAFAGCGLTSVVIGDSVTSIGNYAFNACYKLVEVINKSSHITVTKGYSSNGYVGYYALSVSNCDNTYVSKLTKDNGYIIYTDGAEKILVGYSGTETALTLPSYVTEIYQYAFLWCESLTSITVSEDNENFKDIDGNLYTKDGKTLLQYAIGKKDSSFTVPNGVETIGDYAFYNCDSLTSVVIGDSVTSIGDGAFYECTSLTSITVSEDNANFKDIDGNLYTKDGKTLLQYAIGKKDSSFTIPNGVETIGDRVFSDCSSLTSVVIGDSVTSIGSYAFENCYSLTSIVIPNSVTSIGSYAFYYCSSLTSIIIPNSVTSIGGSAFYSCRGLTSIKYRGTQSQWNAISKGYEWDNYTGDYTMTYNYTGE